jgi:hypothetical protein
MAVAFDPSSRGTDMAFHMWLDSVIGLLALAASAGWFGWFD